MYSVLNKGTHHIHRKEIAMFAQIKEHFEKHRTYKRTLKELSKLTDRELADIGISRGMIREIAREHATGITA